MKHLLLIAIFFTGFATFAQNCTDFKTGTFKYTAAEMKGITIVRTATSQAETQDKTGATVSGPIEWISDCEYVMTCKKVTLKDMEHMLNKQIKVKITKTDGKKYTCTATMEGMEFDMEIIKTAD